MRISGEIECALLKHHRMRIVFFGTPEFASTVLERMVDYGCGIVGVVTTPDRPSGRGHRLQPSSVKETAQKLLPGTPILQPDKLRDNDFLDTLRALEADLFVVVAFRMLPRDVWAMPKCGTFNLHASLLPRYRGAAPIQHAILNGESMTGVTTFFLDEDIDTGRILLQHSVTISDTDNGGTLHDKLMDVGADLVCETIDLIKNAEPGVHLGTSQKELMTGEPLPLAPKIFKQDRELHFTKDSARQIVLRIRAMSPYPAALALLSDGVEIKVFDARVLLDVPGLNPGEVRITDDRRLIVQTVEGAVQLFVIQAPSKRRMAVEDYLLGNEITATFQ